MDSIGARLRKGIGLASESLAMIWKHKTFLLYLGIPATLSFIMILIPYNLLLIRPTTEHNSFFIGTLNSIEFMTALPEWIRKASTIICLFIITLLTVFVEVALIIHTYTMLKKKTLGFIRSFQAALLYWYPIIMWSLLTTAVLIASQSVALWILQKPSHKVIITALTTLLTLFDLLWVLLTFFVIQVIVLEKNRSLISMIISSAKLVWKTLAVLIGGWLWFSLLFLIVATPLNALFFLFAQGGLFALVILSVNILLRYTFDTALVIFKTLCYDLYHLPPDSMAPRRDS
jgi:hypothetical protein